MARLGASAAAGPFGRFDAGARGQDHGPRPPPRTWIATRPPWTPSREGSSNPSRGVRHPLAGTADLFPPPSDSPRGELFGSLQGSSHPLRGVVPAPTGGLRVLSGSCRTPEGGWQPPRRGPAPPTGGSPTPRETSPTPRGGYADPPFGLAELPAGGSESPAGRWPRPAEGFADPPGAVSFSLEWVQAVSPAQLCPGLAHPRAAGECRRRQGKRPAFALADLRRVWFTRAASRPPPPRSPTPA